MKYQYQVMTDRQISKLKDELSLLEKSSSDLREEIEGKKKILSSLKGY